MTFEFESGDRLELPVDGSDYGESAAAFIADHPGLFGPNPTIDVIFVAPDYTKMALAEVDSVTPAPTLKFFEKENQLAWENAVTPVLATLRDAGFDAKAVKRTGDAAEAIAAYAGENADLIVMGSHGWGKFKSAVLGSTAAKVGAATELPILIIRSDKDELLV